jgi:hypothetical protein
LWVEHEGDGEPVLLLAGLGPAGSHVVFHPHFNDLAKTHRVIYLDLYGRGVPAETPSVRWADVSFQGAAPVCHRTLLPPRALLAPN